MGEKRERIVLYIILLNNLYYFIGETILIVLEVRFVCVISLLSLK